MIGPDQLLDFYDECKKVSSLVQAEGREYTEHKVLSRLDYYDAIMLAMTYKWFFQECEINNVEFWIFLDVENNKAWEDNYLINMRIINKKIEI